MLVMWLYSNIKCRKTFHQLSQKCQHIYYLYQQVSSLPVPLAHVPRLCNAVSLSSYLYHHCNTATRVELFSSIIFYYTLHCWKNTKSSVVAEKVTMFHITSKCFIHKNKQMLDSVILYWKHTYHVRDVLVFYLAFDL